MISALIAWGIGFGGVNYIPTHGLLPAAVNLISVVNTTVTHLDPRRSVSHDGDRTVTNLDPRRTVENIV